jgi:O-antigen/teichoic acid export membrane protein
MVKPVSFKNFSLIALSKIVGSGLQSVFYFVFASILTPHQYGELSFYIGIAVTLSLFFRFGFPYSVSVYIGKNEENLSNQINSLAFIIIISSSIFLLFINYYVALLTLGISFFMMNEFNLIGLKKYKKNFIVAIIKGLGILLIPFTLYSILDLPGIVLGMAIANLIVSIDYIKSIKSIKNFSLIRSKFSVLVHNFGIDASSNLSRSIDKIIIVPILGFSMVGFYQLNLQILLGLEMLPIALHSFLLSEESSGNSTKKLQILIVCISILITLFVIFFSPFLITQFLPHYSEGIPSLQVMIFSLIPITFSSIFSAKLQSNESTRIGYSALLRIGSLIIFILTIGSWFGLLGLSLSILFSSSLHALFLFYLYLKMK